MELNRSKAKIFTVDHDPVADTIKFNQMFWALIIGVGAAKNRLHPGDHLTGAEWLTYIIICPKFKT